MNVAACKQHAIGMLLHRLISGHGHSTWLCHTHLGKYNKQPALQMSPELASQMEGKDVQLPTTPRPIFAPRYLLYQLFWSDNSNMYLKMVSLLKQQESSLRKRNNHFWVTGVGPWRKLLFQSILWRGTCWRTVCCISNLAWLPLTSTKCTSIQVHISTHRCRWLFHSGSRHWNLQPRRGWGSIRSCAQHIKRADTLEACCSKTKEKSFKECSNTQMI